MNYGKKVFEEVSRYQLGLAAVMNFTTAGAKTMAAFGAIRWTGIMLATVITNREADLSLQGIRDGNTGEDV